METALGADPPEPGPAADSDPPPHEDQVAGRPERYRDTGKRLKVGSHLEDESTEEQCHDSESVDHGGKHSPPEHTHEAAEAGAGATQGAHGHMTSPVFLEGWKADSLPHFWRIMRDDAVAEVHHLCCDGAHSAEYIAHCEACPAQQCDVCAPPVNADSDSDDSWHCVSCLSLSEEDRRTKAESQRLQTPEAEWSLGTKIYEAICDGDINRTKTLLMTLGYRTNTLLPENRLGFNALHFAVERCQPSLVAFIIDQRQGAVTMPTGGLGIKRKGDVSVPLLTLAGLSYLARRSDDARTILEKVCRQRDLNWVGRDWDDKTPEEVFSEAGADETFLDFVRRKGRDEEGHDLPVPVVPEPEGPGDDARVLIITDPIFREDRSSPRGWPLHPENHLRAEFLVGPGGSLQLPCVARVAKYILQVGPVAREALSDEGQHDPDYVDYLELMANRAPAPGEGVLVLDDAEDTCMTSVSFRGILIATAAVDQAVDAVAAAVGQQGREGICVFLVARRPGHHVGPMGREIVEGVSYGFCLTNSIVQAAVRAKQQGFQRILIVDRDVHHGNGTYLGLQALLDRGFFKKGELLFIDVCGSGKDDSFYPYDPDRSASTESLQVVTVPIVPRKDMGDRYVEAFEKAVLTYGVPFDPDLLLVSNGLDGHAKDASVTPAGVGGQSHAQTIGIGRFLKQKGAKKVPSIWSMEGGYGTNGGAAGPFATAFKDTVMMMASDEA